MVNEPNYRLSKRAEADLVKIARDSLEGWGPDQQRSYIYGLYALFEQLAEMPSLGWDASSVMGANVRVFPYEKTYLVYYRRLSRYRVHIVRVLHGKREQRTALRR